MALVDHLNFFAITALSTSTTYYGSTINTSKIPTSVENNQRVVIRATATLSNIRCVLSSNSITASSTLRSRVNNANGNQSVSIPSSTSGVFEDTVNTDSISGSDTFNASIVTGATGTGAFIIGFGATLNINESRMGFAVTSNITTASTTWYSPIEGGAGLITTESGTQMTCRAGGTLKNGFVMVSSNTRTQPATFKSRKNTADGNISVSVTGSTTGIFEDTSNTDTIIAGDVLNYSFTSGSGTGTTVAQHWGTTFAPSSVGHIYQCFLSGGSGVGAGIVRYAPPEGTVSFAPSETVASSQVLLRGTYQHSNLFCRVITNTTSSGTTNVTLRVNSVDAGPSISIAAAATGYFEDTVNTGTSVPGDNINYKIVGGAGGTTTFSMLGIHADATYTPPAGQPMSKRVFTVPHLAGSRRANGFY